jgi:hypothetical protein
MKKFAFHLLVLYFLLQTVPLDWKYYRELFAIDWAHLNYGGIFSLAHYSPRWTAGPQTYADWGIILAIAAAGALLWTYIDNRRNRKIGGDGAVDYDRLYYWVRVIVRYRLAIGMIAYGFIKLFPLLSPYPSISNLNTSYGDFTRWKLFSLSLGIVPNYESFLGAVEIIGGLLLFYRKTASVGAFIIAVFLGNVFMSNLAYEGGEAVYSLYLISLALFVLSYDVPRLADLLIFQRPASPNKYHVVFTSKGQRYSRLALKTVFIFFFVVLYGFKTRSGYHADPYLHPATQGLPGAAGIYNVSLFVVGKDTVAYSKTDSIRWQDVVFEKWAALSIRSNRMVVDSAEGSVGRQYYSYKVDTAARLLTLQNAGVKRMLHYDRPDGGRIILSGDSIYVVLDRVDKKYLLEEARKTGRQGGLSL